MVWFASARPTHSAAIFCSTRRQSTSRGWSWPGGWADKFSRGLLRVVDDHRRLVVGDLGLRAVRLGDRFLPRRRIEFLRGLSALPQVDAAADTVLAEQIVLADQPGDRLVVRRGLL